MLIKFLFSFAFWLAPLQGSTAEAAALVCRGEDRDYFHKWLWKSEKPWIFPVCWAQGATLWSCSRGRGSLTSPLHQELSAFQLRQEGNGTQRSSSPVTAFSHAEIGIFPISLPISLHHTSPQELQPSIKRGLSGWQAAGSTLISPRLSQHDDNLFVHFGFMSFKCWPKSLALSEEFVP